MGKWLDDCTTWITCTCCGHAVSVTNMNADKEDPWELVELDLWERPWHRGLWYRLKDAVRALRGEYPGFVALDNESAVRLGEALIKAGTPEKKP